MLPYVQFSNVTPVDELELYSWGNNELFKTGLNTDTGNTLVPTKITLGPLWTAIATGGVTGAAIQSRELYTWGDNTNFRTGQNVGTGTTNVPTLASSDVGWSKVSLYNHGLAIQNGELYAWGENGNAKTGRGTTAGNTNVPTKVGVLTTWQQVSAGVSHSIGIANGELYAWGLNSLGRTGLNTTAGNTTAPTKITTPDLQNWERISTLQFSSAGIAGGELYTWGSNSNGRTGLNTVTGNTLVPTKITDPDLNNWSDVSTGCTHACAIAGGEMYCWGANSAGQTGLNTSSGNTLIPTKVGTLNTWTQVFCTFNHTLGIAAGELYAWGSNANGQTGLNITAGNFTVPTKVGSFTDWQQIATKNDSCLALRSKEISGNTPDAVDWSNIIYYFGVEYGQITSQQITGIGSSITLKVEYNSPPTLWYKKGSTDLSGDSGDTPSNEGFTLIANNGTFSVDNNEWVSFMCEHDDKQSAKTVTVKNESDGDAVLDTFNISAQDLP